MKAAVVTAAGKTPIYTDFAFPVAKAGEEIVAVRAAALSNLVKGQAGGSHYSSGSELPFVPGNDGVGTLPDGRRIYFIVPSPSEPWPSGASPAPAA